MPLSESIRVDWEGITDERRPSITNGKNRIRQAKM
jgi:hypothetical protein